MKNLTIECCLLENSTLSGMDCSIS